MTRGRMSGLALSARVDVRLRSSGLGGEANVKLTCLSLILNEPQCAIAKCAVTRNRRIDREVRGIGANSH